MKTSLSLLVIVLSVSTGVCSRLSASAMQGGQNAVAGAAPTPVQAATGAPVGEVRAVELAPFRAELLDLGFDAACAIPVNPHDRDRARVQEAVALSAAELGLVTKAAGMANRIENWRKGSVFGELAIASARDGRREAAMTFAKFAESSLGAAQRWQQERVRVKIAQAHALVGEGDEAKRLERGVGEPEQGKVAAALASKLPIERLDEILADAEKMVETKNFDLAANALSMCAEVAVRLKGDDARWARLESIAERASASVARDIQIRSILRFAEIRAAQGSDAAARALISKAIAARDGARWTPDALLPLTASIARSLIASRDSAAARSEIDAALSRFDSELSAVPDVFRAQPLCAAAEVYALLGDSPEALRIYVRAIEEGARNPNARPRAEDLAQTCASMARAGIEPDAATWERMRAIRADLRDPW